MSLHGRTALEIERAASLVAQETSARAINAFREVCSRSLLAFCAAWLPRRFSIEFGEVHERTARAIQDAMRPEAQRRRLAIAMPPRHGKTSLVAFALPLWAVCARGESRVCVVTRTADAARELFNDLAAALRAGDPLALAYPHAAGPRLRQNVGAAEGPQPLVTGRGSEREDPEGSKGRFAGDMTLPCGACISVVSRFRSVTGASREAKLPTLLVLDDLETWSAPGVLGYWAPEHFEEDGHDLHDALKGWIDFNLDRRLTAGGRCIAVGSIAGPNTWLADRCDLFNRDGWSKISTPAQLMYPPPEESLRVAELMKRGRKCENAIRALIRKRAQRASWPAGVPLAEIAAMRQRADNALPYGLPHGIYWFNALWNAETVGKHWNGWCKMRIDTPATDRFLKGGLHMMTEDTNTGVRAFFAADSKLATRKWFPDSDPPANAQAQEEARTPLSVCVLERPQPGGAPLLTMCSYHEHHPVTDPGLPAYWRVVGEAFRCGRDKTADLRKPEERERLAEEERAFNVSSDGS